MDYRFALFKYSTENIGDEVQSIAARRFLPKVDEYVDRDYLSEYNPDSPTKIIMNGWYNRNPSGWPPKKTNNLKALLTSIHVSVKDPEVKSAFLSDESVDFLSSNGPVGARDYATHDFFEKNGIDSYFSGCITLTLQKDPEIKKQDFILAVDVPKPVVEKMRESTDREIIELTVYHAPYLETKERFFVAEYILALYQSAHAIVTTRLHCFMPSLAFETPVLLIKDSEKYEPQRYGGLDILPHSATDEEYLANPDIFSLDNPPKNPSHYLKIRKEMITRAKDFTGYSNDKTFRTLPLKDLPLSIEFVRIFAYTWSSTFKKALLEGDVSWLNIRIDDYKKNIDDYKKMTDELKTNLAEAEKLNRDMIESTSWKITKPVREISGNIKKISKNH